MKEHAEFIADASPLINSGDDSGNEGKVPSKFRNKPRIVVRRLLHWRSGLFALFLWFLDAIAVEVSSSKIQASNRSGGSSFRIRKYPSSTCYVARDKVPEGLPVNCYSKSFLTSLPKWDLQRLRPIEPRNFEENGRLAEFSKSLFAIHPELEVLLKMQVEGTVDNMPKDD